MSNWWPLERIKNLPGEYEHRLPAIVSNGGRKFLFFPDHCMWCWAWAISCEDDASYGHVALIGGMSARLVADSFTKFVELYTTDWLAVS